MRLAIEASWSSCSIGLRCDLCGQPLELADRGRKEVLKCCPFLTFEFVAQPSMGPIVVRVTGPAGTKNFLKTVLGKPEASI